MQGGAKGKLWARVRPAVGAHPFGSSLAAGNHAVRGHFSRLASSSLGGHGLDVLVELIEHVVGKGERGSASAQEESRGGFVAEWLEISFEELIDRGRCLGKGKSGDLHGMAVAFFSPSRGRPRTWRERHRFPVERQLLSPGVTQASP